MYADYLNSRTIVSVIDLPRMLIGFGDAVMGHHLKPSTKYINAQEIGVQHVMVQFYARGAFNFLSPDPLRLSGLMVLVTNLVARIHLLVHEISAAS
jgi:hypothetical protein